MRRRLIQLLVVLIAVGALVEVGTAQSYLWCTSWTTCEPGWCSGRLTQFEYELCCYSDAECDDWRWSTGWCC